MKSLITALTLSLGLVSATASQASLVDRGGGLIYDTDLNITWLANANVNGAMTWNNAMTWASNLSYYDSVRNVTYTNWRLPTTLQPDPACGTQNSGVSYGHNCVGSEMGHLFYNELGGVAGQSIATTHNDNYNLFQNLQPDGYWSGTEFVRNTGYAWAFSFSDGYQPAADKNLSGYAWAVRPGDVAAPTVPVPAAVWLFSSGLLGLVGIARCRRPLNAVT